MTGHIRYLLTLLHISTVYTTRVLRHGKITRAGDFLLNSLTTSGKPHAATLSSADLGKVPPEATVALRRIWEYGPSELTRPPSSECAMTVEDAGLVHGQCALASGLVYRAGPVLNNFFAETFQAVTDTHKRHGCKSCVSRYDLFHAHFFRSENGHTGDGLLGLLFHCFEYPALDNAILRDANLGHCQVGSTCRPSLRDWRYRNVLWAAWPLNADELPKQNIWLLDGSVDKISDLRMDATPFGPDCPNAVWEGHFGSHISNVLHLERSTGVWFAQFRP